MSARQNLCDTILIMRFPFSMQVNFLEWIFSVFKTKLLAHVPTHIRYLFESSSQGMSNMESTHSIFRKIPNIKEFFPPLFGWTNCSNLKYINKILITWYNYFYTFFLSGSSKQFHQYIRSSVLIWDFNISVTDACCKYRAQTI